MPNFGEFSRLYRQIIRGTGAAGELVRLELERVPPARLRFLTHVTVENLDNDYDLNRLGIKAGGTDYYLDELDTIEADELAVSRSDIPLGEGDIFFSELTGTSDGDKLVMVCVGWELDL